MDFRSLLVLVMIFLTPLGLVSLAEDAFSQNLNYDYSMCPSCVIIPPHEIELYKDLFPLIIWTDERVYDHQSIIEVNGFLKPENSHFPVIITVTNPIGNIVTVEQLTPQESGEFSINFNTASSLWKKDGSYIIKAQSGPQTRVFKVGVNLQQTVDKSPLICQPGQFSADGHCISFKITGGSVTGAEINEAEKSLVINIKADSRGTLTLTPTKTVMTGYSMIYIDGKETRNYTIGGQTVTVMFNEGAKEIKIFATHVIPEFQTIAIFVLIAGILFVVASNRIPGLRLLKSPRSI